MTKVKYNMYTNNHNKHLLKEIPAIGKLVKEKQKWLPKLELPWFNSDLLQ